MLQNSSFFFQASRKLCTQNRIEKNFPLISLPGSQPSPCFHYKLLYPPSAARETTHVLLRDPCPMTLAMPPEQGEQRVCRGGSPQCRDIHRNTPCPQGHPTAGLQLGLSAACSTLSGPHLQGPCSPGAWLTGGGSQLGSPQVQCGSEEEQSTEMQLLHRFIV